MDQIRTNPLSKSLFPALALAGAYALKRHYSLASADELDWILRPTAALVSMFSGSTFVRVHAGYANEGLHTIIVPACAGVNYLIVVFCTLTFGFVVSIEHPATKTLFFAASAFIAYVTTLVVNAARIELGMVVRRQGAFGSVVTAEQAHRVVGVAVYLVSLWLIYRAADACTRRALAWRKAHP